MFVFELDAAPCWPRTGIETRSAKKNAQEKHLRINRAIDLPEPPGERRDVAPYPKRKRGVAQFPCVRRVLGAPFEPGSGLNGMRVARFVHSIHTMKRHSKRRSPQATEVKNPDAPGCIHTRSYSLGSHSTRLRLTPGRLHSRWPFRRTFLQKMKSASDWKFLPLKPKTAPTRQTTAAVYDMGRNSRHIAASSYSFQVHMTSCFNI